MLPKGAQLAAGAQQAPEPIAGCLGAASPTAAARRLLTLPFLVRPPLSCLHRLLVISSFVVLSGRPAAGTSVTPIRFDRHLSGGRTTCCPTAAQLAACAQQAPEPIAGCLRAASPTAAARRLLTLPFLVRPPLSCLLHRLLVISSFCRPVRPPRGRYLSDAGSLRSAPVGRANNVLSNRGSTRRLRAAGSGTDSRLPRWRFINDRRPRALDPSVPRPSSSLLVSLSSRHFLLCGPVRPPAARRCVDAGVQSGSAYICQVAAVVDGGEAACSARVTAEVPCAFMVTPLCRDVLWTAGAEQVAATTAPGCAWTAASESGFLAVTSAQWAPGLPR